MSRHFSALLLIFLVFLAPRPAHGFVLLGNKATWMTAEVGYYGGDIGGPMYLGEGYRYNMPILTYSYDASFLNYFGGEGVAAVESAMKIINGLTNADLMSDTLAEFQTYSVRHNATAGALGLYDLKTYSLSLLLEQLGVASPERYVWSIRAHHTYPTTPLPTEAFSVINPNYDPATLRQSAYINDVLYTYQIFTLVGPQWIAGSLPVDLDAPIFSTVAHYTQAAIIPFGRGDGLVSAPGVYFPRLTREDVAPLRHQLRTQRYAVESLLPDVLASNGRALGVTVGSGGVAGAGGGGLTFTGNSPWSPVFSVLTTTAGGSGTSPWTPIFSSTNVVGGGTLTISNSPPAVVNALRPGVGKVTFVQIGYDSILGSVAKPTSVTWLDRFVTNGVMRIQAVARSITQPDIIFGAADLGVINEQPIFVARGGSYVDNSALNRAPGAGIGEAAGPGIINGFSNLTFSKIGRYYLNFGAGTQDTGTQAITWGSFDGSTNPIVVYPSGTSVKTIEELVRKGR